MLVTAGMRESERSKAKSRTTNMQVTFSASLHYLLIGKIMYLVGQIILGWFTWCLSGNVDNLGRGNTFGGISGNDSDVSFQMKRMKKAGKEGTGKWQIADGQSEIQSEMSGTIMSSVQ